MLYPYYDFYGDYDTLFYSWTPKIQSEGTINHSKEEIIIKYALLKGWIDINKMSNW